MLEIKELLTISKRLKEKYSDHKRNFTISGNIIGDIGEVLAAEKYGLRLFAKNTKVHDAEELATGRKIQIRASLQGRSYFTINHGTPDYFLSFNITEEGKIEEIFNGPGQFIIDQYVGFSKLSPSREIYYILNKDALKNLNTMVLDIDKIKPVQ